MAQRLLITVQRSLIEQDRTFQDIHLPVEKMWDYPDSDVIFILVIFLPRKLLLAVLPKIPNISLLFPLLQCHSLQNSLFLHNIIVMDACAFQAVLYQTLSQHIAPMAIRLILVSFSRPAMVGNWKVSSIISVILNVFLTAMSGLSDQTYLVGDYKVSIIKC